MDFLPVTDNLRDSFRILASGRDRADTGVLPGVDLASLGVAFQMFNAAFLNGPVATEDEMNRSLAAAREHFDERRMRWSFWVCDSWLESGIRRKLSRLCRDHGLMLASEMPGMSAKTIVPERPGDLPVLDVREVDSIHRLAHFQAVGSTCFHVPITWFSEVFNGNLEDRRGFRCWVAYLDGVPVSSAAVLVAGGAAGIYNIATMPGYRKRGYGEAITRFVIAEARRGNPDLPVVLQSTGDGLRIYERMGFRAVTRILVFNSRD